jgi:hypothetical protein
MYTHARARTHTHTLYADLLTMWPYTVTLSSKKVAERCELKIGSIQKILRSWQLHRWLRNTHSFMVLHVHNNKSSPHPWHSDNHIPSFQNRTACPVPPPPQKKTLDQQGFTFHPRDICRADHSILIFMNSIMEQNSKWVWVLSVLMH